MQYADLMVLLKSRTKLHDEMALIMSRYSHDKGKAIIEQGLGTN